LIILTTLVLPPTDDNTRPQALVSVGSYGFTCTLTVPNHIAPTRIVHTAIVVWIRIDVSMTGSKNDRFDDRTSSMCLGLPVFVLFARVCWLFSLDAVTSHAPRVSKGIRRSFFDAIFSQEVICHITIKVTTQSTYLGIMSTVRALKLNVQPCTSIPDLPRNNVYC